MSNTTSVSSATEPNRTEGAPQASPLEALIARAAESAESKTTNKRNRQLLMDMAMAIVGAGEGKYRSPEADRREAEDCAAVKKWLLRFAGAKPEQAKRLCVGCRHYIVDELGVRFSMCGHPQIASPVDGSPQGYCTIERTSDASPCGPAGALFESKA
jgi:hypothetical protein